MDRLMLRELSHLVNAVIREARDLVNALQWRKGAGHERHA